jgi:acyl dehydratase
MGEENSIIGELTGQMGRESPPHCEEVEKGAIRRFVNALGDHNPLYEDEAFAKRSRYGGKIAPPLFAITFNRERRPQPDNRLGKGAVNAGNEFEFFGPIRPGDVLTHTTKLADIKQRMGKLGRMFVLTYETTCVNQRGELVAICRWIIITHEGLQTGAA